MIEHILFKDLSHIRAICEHINENIKMIPEGEEYSGLFLNIYPTCEIDHVKPKWWQSYFIHEYDYKATEDRWTDGDIVGTMEDIVQEWNGHIKFVTDHQDDSTYAVTKSHIILHFLDGEKKTIWFENDNEMNSYLTETMHRVHFNEILFVDDEMQTTRMAD